MGSPEASSEREEGAGCLMSSALGPMFEEKAQEAGVPRRRHDAVMLLARTTTVNPGGALVLDPPCRAVPFGALSPHVNQSLDGRYPRESLTSTGEQSQEGPASRSCLPIAVPAAGPTNTPP